MMTLTSGRDVVDGVAAWITDNIVGHLATLAPGWPQVDNALALVRRVQIRATIRSQNGTSNNRDALKLPIVLR